MWNIILTHREQTISSPAFPARARRAKTSIRVAGVYCFNTFNRLGVISRPVLVRPCSHHRKWWRQKPACHRWPSGDRPIRALPTLGNARGPEIRRRRQTCRDGAGPRSVADQAPGLALPRRAFLRSPRHYRSRRHQTGNRQELRRSGAVVYRAPEAVVLVGTGQGADTARQSNPTMLRIG